MNIKSIPELLNSSTAKATTVAAWVVIVVVTYLSIMNIVGNRQSDIDDLSYATSEVQQTIDSQLRDSALLNFGGGCNCPTCCRATSYSMYNS